MKTKTLNLAVVGATGLVGQEMLRVLTERNFPLNRVLPLATARSKGGHVSCHGTQLTVEETELAAFKGIDIALFAGGDKSSQLLAKDLAKQGVLVIDNSSTFRMEPEVPLVIPEVNPDALKKHKGIIANPNCSTIQMVLAMKPIYDQVGIEHLIVSTYQSVSGTGKDAVEALKEETRQALSGAPVTPKIYPQQIAFNCLPQAWSLDFETFYTEEELKMVRETKKILSDNELKVSVTAVRVPVYRGHGESVYLLTRKKLMRNEALNLWENFPGIKLMEDPENRKYPTQLDAEGNDWVYVGHVREDLDHSHGLFFWVVSDNLRKGAATNAVQIAEKMIELNLL
jgi:aspartate-semialdehyde dehydrogenase